MRGHLSLSDDEFVDQFENLTLRPALFSHEAHLRLAFVYLRNFSIIEAIDKIRNGILSFDRKHGDGSKYHETLTVAAVHVINHFRQKQEIHDFSSLLKAYPRLKKDFKQLLLTHYSEKRLFAKDSKYCYLEPDLIPFT